MEAFVDSILTRSRSAHISQKPCFITKEKQQIVDFQKKNSIKLLKQSFPPDFFTNPNINTKIRKRSIARLPQILLNKEILARPNNLQRNSGLRVKIDENRLRDDIRNMKKKIEISLNLVGFSHRDFKNEEINTPCFPDENKAENEKPIIKKRKVFFCKEIESNKSN